MSKREQIIEAADQLFYEKGFEQTSFADIAGAVKISRGNFYYHFKTKDEILCAVITKRLADRAQLLSAWEKIGKTPIERIQCFINILIVNRNKIMKYGCPVGTLVTELAKLDHGSKAQANEIFTLFQDWLSQQFRAMGREKDAVALAAHILARSQGVSTLAAAFQDMKFVDREVTMMTDWLTEITNNKAATP